VAQFSPVLDEFIDVTAFHRLAAGQDYDALTEPCDGTQYLFALFGAQLLLAVGAGVRPAVQTVEPTPASNFKSDKTWFFLFTLHNI
jgi:hypothetical protein